MFSMKHSISLSYLGDGHGDVEELSPASLRNGTSEEQLQPVFGKQRLLILKTQKDALKHHKVKHQIVFVSVFSPVCGAILHFHPLVSAETDRQVSVNV